MKNKLLSILSALWFGMLPFAAQADMVTDAHGNVGYDTAAECDAAVQDGSARFYQPFTSHKPMLRKGEKGVQQASIRDLGPEYKMGACDMGVGRKMNRDGVSVALQGKYIPFSPDMPINAYTDATGAVVRVTMAQCDNWFSGNAPRPVSFVKQVAKSEEPVAEPVVEQTAAAPVETPAAASIGITPYVFGTLGVVHDGVRIDSNRVAGFSRDMNEFDTRFGGQVGLGLRFNNWLGAEAFYQGARDHYYSQSLCVANRTVGARATLGHQFNKTNLFIKAGAAGVKHTRSWRLGDGKYVVRPTAGVGVTHNITDNVAFRADYDHYFHRSGEKAENNGARWKGANYVGAGIQYNF